MAELAIMAATGLGASTSAAATIGAVTTAASVAIPIMGAVAGNKNARQQSAEYSREAREQRVTSSIQAERRRREARRLGSRDFAATAEAGALSGTGLAVLEQNEVARELDALTVEYQGEQAGRSAEFQGRQAVKSASPLNVWSAAIGAFNQVDPMNIQEGLYGG